MRGLTALADRPHHQRLAAPHVAGGEDLRVRGLILVGVGLHVAARIELEPERLDHALVHRMHEAHGEQHEIGLEVELGAGDRLELVVAAHAFELRDLDVSGRDLKSAIENGLSRLPGSSGRFPQVSGMTVEFELAREPGSRVTAMRVGGAPLDESRTYRVAVLDYLARGSDDYAMFSNARRITPDNDAPLMVNEVVEYLRKLGTARTGVEGRMVGR